MQEEEEELVMEQQQQQEAVVVEAEPPRPADPGAGVTAVVAVALAEEKGQAQAAEGAGEEDLLRTFRGFASRATGKLWFFKCLWWRIAQQPGRAWRSCMHEHAPSRM